MTELVKVRGRAYAWRVDADRDPAFRDAVADVRSLRIWSSDAPLDVSVAIRPPVGDLLFLGPAFVRDPGLPCQDGRQYVGKYFLFPAFKIAKHAIVHGEMVRSIVESLLDAKRLRQCDVNGVDLRSPFAKQSRYP